MKPDTTTPLLSTEDTISRIKQGYILLHQRRYSEAAHVANTLLSNHPHDVGVMVLASEALLIAGDKEHALTLIEQAIAALDDDPYLKLKKARLLGLSHRRKEFLALLDEVAVVAQHDPRLSWQLGSLCYRNNLHAEAVTHLERARKPMGDPPNLLYELAINRFFNGDFEQAEQDLEHLLHFSPQSGPALYLRATLRKQTPEKNHLKDLRQRLRIGFSNAGDEAAALYALGKELEDIGEHAESFNAISAGATKKRRTFHYESKAECDALQEIADAYTKEAITSGNPGHDDKGAIFIVGMPRSGTTLCERILTQSGHVTSAGELQDFGNLLLMQTQLAQHERSRDRANTTLSIDFDKLGRDYVNGARQTAKDSQIFIDKMPTNFMYCGMIHKALPNARIIHLVRDPMDSCYAMYKTLFFDVFGFSYNLQELADYYIAYRKIMNHWHTAMPGRILDVKYEDLVTDTENQAQRLYHWCDLKWNKNVMELPSPSKTFASASAAQVRQPVHSRSIGSAARHQERLAPLAHRLTEANLITR